MEHFLIFILILILLAVLLSVADFEDEANKEIREDKKKRMEEELDALSDFSPSQKVIGEDINSGIAVDEGRKKYVL